MAALDYFGAAAASFLNEKRVNLDKNKQFAINMIAQVVGFVVMMGIGFLLTPFIVEHVGSEAYGFVGLMAVSTTRRSSLSP